MKKMGANVTPDEFVKALNRASKKKSKVKTIKLCPNCSDQWRAGYDAGVRSQAKGMALYDAISNLVYDLTRKEDY